MSDAQLTTEEVPSTVNHFSSSNGASVVRNVQAARAILRTVVLAIGAQEDGSVSFDDDSGSSRWNPITGDACSRLRAVRAELMETACAPDLDWVTPLALAEALDVALWFGYSCKDENRLSNLEAISAAKVVIDSLDVLLQECDAAGIFKIAAVH